MAAIAFPMTGGDGHNIAPRPACEGHANLLRIERAQQWAGAMNEFTRRQSESRRVKLVVVPEIIADLTGRTPATRHAVAATFTKQ